jgi:hypothetical protein
VPAIVELHGKKLREVFVEGRVECEGAECSASSKAMR